MISKYTIMPKIKQDNQNGYIVLSLDNPNCLKELSELNIIDGLR